MKKNRVRNKLEIALWHMSMGYKPTHLVIAVRLPNRAVELIVDTYKIDEKIDYILKTYDENMAMKGNPAIFIKDVMIVG